MTQPDKNKEQGFGPPALQVSGVSHSFGEKKALDDVSLTVPRGVFTVLLGLNGAGKSTLLAAMRKAVEASRTL